MAKEIPYLSGSWVGSTETKTLFYNNRRAVSEYKEPKNHKKGKQIEQKYYLISEFICERMYQLKNVSAENLVDPFAKTRTEKVFVTHLESMAIRFWKSDLQCKWEIVGIICPKAHLYMTFGCSEQGIIILLMAI